jgi:hypothetical protein
MDVRTGWVYALDEEGNLLICESFVRADGFVYTTVTLA